MRKILLVGTCLLALSACQAHNPQTQGALIGGLTGGLLGSTVGKGSGRMLATGAGAVLGTIVGTNLGANNRNTHARNDYEYNQYYNQRASANYSPCARIVNDGARAACERGVAERDRAAQKQAEQRAYECGRYGRCN